MKGLISAIKLNLAVNLSKLTSKLNGQYATGILVENNGLRIVVEPYDMFVGRQLRRRGRYGEDELKKIRKLVNDSSHVAFVGAHVGALAIPIVSTVEKAYLIEANPKTFRLLETNLAINKIENVEVYNCAAGEKDGEINFVLSTVNSGGSKREPIKKEHIYYYDKPLTVKVPMKTIDGLLDDSSEKMDMILLDIEGSEYFALEGMQKTLERTNSLVIEFIGHHLKNVSQVSVTDLVPLIKPYFDHLYVPSTESYVSSDEFESTLIAMYDKGIDDEGIVFSKQKIVF